MTYIKKGFFLIVGTALMVVLLLAAGGVHLLPEYVFKSLMENELWSAVGGMFSMMLLPGAVVGQNIRTLVPACVRTPQRIRYTVFLCRFACDQRVLRSRSLSRSILRRV